MNSGLGVMGHLASNTRQAVEESGDGDGKMAEWSWTSVILHVIISQWSGGVWSKQIIVT